jgi:hypothetical protein
MTAIAKLTKARCWATHRLLIGKGGAGTLAKEGAMSRFTYATV